MLLFLLVGILIFANDVQTIRATQETILVPDDYPTIQVAIDAAHQGDTIFVRAGIYYECVVVNKALRLIGENADTTVISGGGRNVITLRADNVEIINFTLQSFPEPGVVNLEDPFNGVYICSANNCKIVGNRVMYSLHGIYLQRSFYNIVNRNVITNNWYGIYLEHSSYNAFRNNNITNNSGNFGIAGCEFSHFIQDVDLTNIVDGKPMCYWINRQSEEVPFEAGYVALVNCKNITLKELDRSQGILLVNTTGSIITRNNIQNKSCPIYLWMSFNNTICENNITNSGQAIYLCHSSDNVIRENKLVNNLQGIELFSSCENIISENNILYNKDGIYQNDGIRLESSSNNNIVYGNTVDNYSEGISLHDSSKNIIQENNVTNNLNGLHLSGSSYNNIHNNNAINNNDGILLKDSSNHNVIYKNNVTNNDDAGVAFVFSDNNKIYENRITNNRFGCFLSFSSNNTIHNNRMMGNIEIGVFLLLSSYNKLYWNNIEDNNIGVDLCVSSSNLIHHNNFIDNIKQVHDISWENPNAPHSMNNWDDGYPSGGNYWSDYAGIDNFCGPDQNQTGSDGIGDTSYTIDENNRDRYPLMTCINVFNADTLDGISFNIAIGSNSTVYGFQLHTINGTISFELTGETDVGCCRITIPNVIVQSLWQGNYTVLIDGEPLSNIRNWTDDINTYIYFTYQHSERQVTIIPEFPLNMLLPLLMLATVPSILLKKKLKH